MPRYLSAADSDLEFALKNRPASLWALILLDTDLDVTEEDAAVLLALATLYDTDLWCPWGAEWYTPEQVATYTRLPQELGVQKALDRLLIAGLVRMDDRYRFRPLTMEDSR